MTSSGMTLPHAGIETDVEHMRLRAVLVFQDRHSLGRNDLRYRVIRVFEVGQPPGAERAALHTGRLQALADPVITEISLLGRPGFGIEEAHTVGAGHDAVAATDAPFPVDQHDAVVGLVGRPHRADLYAG